MDRLYRRFRDRYGYVVFAATLASTCAIGLASIGIVALFFTPPLAEVVLVAAVGTSLAGLSVAYSALTARPAMATIRRWQRLGVVTPKETVAAWEVASTLTLRQFQRNALLTAVVAIAPTAFLAGWRWDIGWSGVGAILLAGAIPGAYGTVVAFSVNETMRRPIIVEIAQQLPDDWDFSPRGLSVEERLRLSIPVYVTGTAVVVVGLVSSGGGPDLLVVTTLTALGVGLFMSFELTSILSRGITEPIAVVRRQLELVHEGDYEARALVITSDELGSLAHEFNLMARGLSEREEMRRAFGTYVDKEVMRLILSGDFPRDGVEVDASILFCDIRGFTAYAEQSDAAHVVATLNDIFTDIVPVVEAYGGYVDKFLGDGLLAVFGVADSTPDHADRAVDAAQMLVDVVDQGGSGLRMAAGVNTGRLVVGPLGGAGRLNFSVIGDAVNVAARVEAATRQTGDDVLVTASTRAASRDPERFASRGLVDLKGKSEPIEVFAPLPALDPVPR